jgi:coenzyme F420-reducing hydrogenase delta subunit
VWFVMVFDMLSFLAGVAGGAIAGALAGTLHGLEGTATLQERVRQVTREVEKIKRVGLPHASVANPLESTSEVDRLYQELSEIHEEIRRMYKKGKS